MSKETVKRESKSRRNGWKIAFLLLLGLLVGISIFLGVRIFDNREPSLSNISKVADSTNESPTFQIHLTKKQVNQIMEYYMNDYVKNSKQTYTFYLENQALLKGSIEVLGYPVEFYLYFEPYVLENGNIQLNAKSVSIGTLNLPISYVLNYASKSLKVPDWVKINSKEEYVLLDLTQFKMKNGMSLKADKINLTEDDIRFNIYLPLK